MADHDSAARNPPCPPSINDTAVILWWVIATLLLGFALQALALYWGANRLEQHCGDAAGTEPRVVATQCAEPKMPLGGEGQHVVHGAQHARAQGRGA